MTYKYHQIISPSDLKDFVYHYTHVCPLQYGEKASFLVLGIDGKIYNVIYSVSKYGSINETVKEHI